MYACFKDAAWWQWGYNLPEMLQVYREQRRIFWIYLCFHELKPYSCHPRIPPHPKTFSTLGCGDISISNRKSIELFSWLSNLLNFLTISSFPEFSFRNVSVENWFIISSCWPTHLVEKAEVLILSAWIAVCASRPWLLSWISLSITTRSMGSGRDRSSFDPREIGKASDM